MSPQATIKLVTPEWAFNVLEKHDKAIMEGVFSQRRITEATVDKYAADMVQGNWALTGQGVTFDTDGNLLDGQHRLAAIVKSGCSLQMLIVTNANKDVKPGLPTINTFDNGKNRSLNNQLGIDGVLYSANIASTVTVIVNNAFTVRRNSVSISRGVQIAHLINPHTQPLIQLLCKDNADKNKWSGRILAPLVLLRSYDKKTVESFAQDYNEMANLGKTSPVLQFAKFMQRPLMTSGGRDSQEAVFKALASALWSYSNDAKTETIRGNDEHVEWLLRKARPFLTEIARVVGFDTFRYIGKV